MRQFADTIVTGSGQQGEACYNRCDSGRKHRPLPENSRCEIVAIDIAEQGAGGQKRARHELQCHQNEHDQQQLVHQRPLEQPPRLPCEKERINVAMPRLST